MELLAEVQKLKSEYKKAQQDSEKATKEVEKLQKQLNKLKEEKEDQKQYEKDLKKAVEEDLKRTFKNCLERQGLEKGYINLCLNETRTNIIKNVAESSIESEYIDQIYESTLNKVKKIYDNDEKAKQALLQLQMQEQIKQQQAKKERTNIYYNLMNILFLLFNPVSLIIILFIAGYFFIASPILK